MNLSMHPHENPAGKEHQPDDWKSRFLSAGAYFNLHPLHFAICLLADPIHSALEDQGGSRGAQVHPADDRKTVFEDTPQGIDERRGGPG